MLRSLWSIVSHSSCVRRVFASKCIDSYTDISISLKKSPDLARFFSFLFVFALFNPQSLTAQSDRMAIEASLQLDGKSLPPTAPIRVLRRDSSIVKTVLPYYVNTTRFGVRVSSSEGFAENDPILFRVVLSKRDSFVARTSGPALIFHGTPENKFLPTVRVNLFRNHPPQFRRQLPDTAIDEGQRLRYRAIAIDLDADTIFFKIVQAPVGASVDSITGLFVWTPTFFDAGIHSVVLQAHDGHEAALSRTTTVVVKNVNRPPRFVQMASDTVVREGETLRFTYLAIDPDNDTLQYLLVETGQRLTLTSENGVFDWTPNFDQAGQHFFRAIVQDGSLSDTSSECRVNVLNVNRPPVFVSAVKESSVIELQQLKIAYKAFDPDGDSLKFSLLDAPSGAILSVDGGFQWVPSFVQAGEHTVVVSVSDGSLKSEAATRVRVVNSNRKPSAVRLLKPAHNDTLRFPLVPKDFSFSWAKSFDEDGEDTLRYRFRVWGGSFDTTVANLIDTTVSLNLKTHLQPASSYDWTVLVSDGHDTVASPDTFVVRISKVPFVAKENLDLQPRFFSLEQNFPNPFNPMTSIRYGLPERSFVKVTIYNMLGEHLRTLVSEEKESGTYEITFDASSLTSGVYMFKLEAHPVAAIEGRSFISTKKMILVK